mgnify:CR=1 FL=1
MRQKIAIIGSGISGLGTGYLLSPHHDVTIYEADHRPGGHSHTVDVHVDGQRFGVDTGFLVFNERTYPLLCRLFAHIQVPVVKSDMSFSVKIAEPDLEWAGTNLATVFAQRSNLLKPHFLGMVRDETTLEAHTYADRLPHDLHNRPVFVLDPMLATGGTLAAVCALHARDIGLELALQLLITPGTTAHADTPSHKQFAEGHLLDAQTIAWFFGNYIDEGQRRLGVG